MPVRKGPMAAIVSKSWQAIAFQPEQQWGYALMLGYARQIDSAEKLKAETLDIIDQYNKAGGTANVKWWQRIERIEKYVQAEATVNKTGPLLLTLMKEFGLTPANKRPAVVVTEIQGGVKNDGGASVQPPEDPEDELAKLRAERGRHTRAG